jgi:hypothetical protein
MEVLSLVLPRSVIGRESGQVTSAYGPGFQDRSGDRPSAGLSGQRDQALATRSVLADNRVWGAAIEAAISSTLRATG